MNVAASNTAAELVKEDITYKATIITAQGNKSPSFLYKLDWYDDNNFHEIEFANMAYSKNITNAGMALANQIDTYS